MDSPLANHPCVVLKRWALGLPGREGHLPDPLRDIIKIGTLVDDPSKKFRVTTDPVTRKPSIKLLHGEKTITLPDGTSIRQIAVDVGDLDTARNTLATFIQRSRRDAGVDPLSELDLEREVSAVLAQEPQAIVNPTIGSRINIDTFGFQLGLLKISYELAWRWLGERYLDDPVAGILRKALLASDRKAAVCAIECVQCEMNFPHASGRMPLAFWDDDVDCHIAFSLISGSDLTIFVRIFDCVSCAVVVTKSANLYTAGQFDQNASRFLRIDPSGHKIRDTRLIEEIGRLFLAGKFILTDEAITNMSL